MEEIQSRNKGRVKEALVKLRQFFKIDSTEGAKEEVGFEADEKFHVVPIVPSGCRFYKANENSIANRYFNILPYDWNRVKLKLDAPEDYVNASYIVSKQDDVVQWSYIATQGPLAETMQDFWQMVLENKVSAIVMLTNLIEDTMQKCAEYFPSSQGEKLEVGSVVVKNSLVEMCSKGLEKRTLEVACSKHGKKAVVEHYHYRDWPDHGTPLSYDALLDLSNIIRTKHSSSPVVVHCSAGIGRTGTFCLVDITLRRILSPESSLQKGSVDKVVALDKLLLELRKGRVSMVQTVEQFKFACNAILYELRRYLQL